MNIRGQEFEIIDQQLQGKNKLRGPKMIKDIKEKKIPEYDSIKQTSFKLEKMEYVDMKNFVIDVKKKKSKVGLKSRLNKDEVIFAI